MLYLLLLVLDIIFIFTSLIVVKIKEEPRHCEEASLPKQSLVKLPPFRFTEGPSTSL
ncbi:MAG: hypothetical protein KatS3mg027_1999 [Bacteroidia bacterium]|nr:MAG: hypothetical protein KatS3mg027_1999 [Bacteroidia bacterium]